MLDQITPLILTYNEEANIQRTLQRLTWAKQIIVIDSYSTDNTTNILKEYYQVQLFQRSFDTHTQQWNYGLEQVKSEWVLSLDADYVLSDELLAELEKLPLDISINGYFARFRYCVFGKPLKGTLLPPRQVFFRKDKAIYTDDGHTQLLKVEGKSGQLSGYIYHDDRKLLSRWLWAQDRYMIIEAKKLHETPYHELNWRDRVRKTKIFSPWIILLYCLLVNRCLFDGWAGWYYTLQRVLAEIWLTIRLLEQENVFSRSKNLTQK